MAISFPNQHMVKNLDEAEKKWVLLDNEEKHLARR
jgi:hypothetical protein